MLQFLVVDQDDYVSDMLTEAIHDAFGAQVAQARNGELATRVLHERAFDLAVIEAMLPDMTGFELAERAAKCNVPALLMSGHPTGQETCRAYGYPHLEKPFSLDKLADAARTLIRDSQQVLTCLHQSFEKLSATFGQSVATVLGIEEKWTQAPQMRNRLRQIREQSSRLHLESAIAPYGSRSPSAWPLIECSIMLDKIVALRGLLRQGGSGLCSDTERAAKLLLAEEEVKLAVLAYARERSEDARPKRPGTAPSQPHPPQHG